MTASDPNPANPTVSKSLRVDPEVWRRFRILSLQLDADSNATLAALLDHYENPVSETASVHGGDV